MQIKELINNGIQILKENKIEDSNIKARVLLQYVLKQNKSYLITNYNEEVNEKNEIIYNQYIQELIKGKPIQYITKTQEFMGLEFYVDENVLIPQPDTEILVEEAIKEIEKILKSEDKGDIIKVLDMCTGSGAIAISIAKHFQERKQDVKIEIYAVDISKEALEIAEKNANTNQVQITFIQSDMFKEIENESFDIIVSNPPYIETEVIKTLSEEVKKEPHIALDGGQDGLEFYKIIAQEGRKYLKRSGSILLEIGYNQRECVTSLFKETNKYNNIICIKDLSGNDRVIKI